MHSDKNIDESLAVEMTEPTDEHDEDCECQECIDEREAEKDRLFDEKVALGYFF